MSLLIGWLGRVISGALYFGPAWFRRACALVLAFLWFDLFRIRRRDVLENLKIAFPELSDRERVRLARQSLRTLGLNFVEYSFLPWLNTSNYSSKFLIENRELVDQALAQKKGVLLLTLHLGHGDLSCAALSLAGYKMYMVSKFFRAQWLNDLWFGVRERAGTKFVPPRDSSYTLLRGLKNNGIVVFPLDQFTGPPIGVRTTFFGRETGTAAGLAVMAARSKAPVVLCYTRRLEDGRHLIRFDKQLPVLTGQPEQTTQMFNDELEILVRRYPDQWMWIHRRWKIFRH